MTAQLIDGIALSKKIRAEVSGRTAALRAKGIQPALAIILVGEDPASQVYTRHKVSDSTETGLKATLETYPADLPEAQFAQWLTSECKVAAIPVSAFYSSGIESGVVRFCFAKEDATLALALERLGKL